MADTEQGRLTRDQCLSKAQRCRELAKAGTSPAHGCDDRQFPLTLTCSYAVGMLDEDQDRSRWLRIAENWLVIPETQLEKILSLLKVRTLWWELKHLPQDCEPH